MPAGAFSECVESFLLAKLLTYIAKKNAHYEIKNVYKK